MGLKSLLLSHHSLICTLPSHPFLHALLCPPCPPQETGRYPAYKEMVSEYCWLDRCKWLRPQGWRERAEVGGRGQNLKNKWAGGQDLLRTSHCPEP